MRVKAIIAYDGSGFEGFQRQKRTTNTVTTTIENALTSLGIESKIVGSGRTDAKVHATGQVIHFDLPLYWQSRSLKGLREYLNRRLETVEFRAIDKVNNSFHARFDARERVYRYIFKTERPGIFERKFTSFLSVESVEIMSDTLKYFVGKHDFAMLSKKGSETQTTIRTIFKAYLKESGGYYSIYFHGDGFLRAQVRSMIDLSLKVANGKITVDEMKEQIEAKSRYSTDLAPPQGLYLTAIKY
jgi:tRNA pseudouridine38-40 synthase